MMGWIECASCKAPTQRMANGQKYCIACAKSRKRASLKAIKDKHRSDPGYRKIEAEKQRQRENSSPRRLYMEAWRKSEACKAQKLSGARAARSARAVIQSFQIMQGVENDQLA